MTQTIGGNDLSIEHQIDDLQRQLKKFSTTGLKRAQFRAMNKSLGKARTVAVRRISEKRNLKQKDARPKITLFKASPNRLTATIQARGPMIKLIKVKGSKTQTKLGVKVSAEKGKRTLIKGAFIADMKNAKRGIFKRNKNASNYDGRLPIQEQTSPSVAHTLIEKEISDEINETFQENYEIDLFRQLNNEIRKAQRG